MAIESIGGKLPSLIQEVNKQTKDISGFGNVLGEFIGSVNDDQLKSAQITKDFINGDGVEIHEVMIAGEKAKTSLELLMEIRNKTVDMYRELTRMSI